MTKDELFEKFGKHDGNDDDRLLYAVEMSGELDVSVWLAFEKLVSLEDKGLIKLTGEKS